MVKKFEMLYEGKAKQIFRTENENEVIVHYKDDATAFNGEKKAQIDNKGILNNAITSMIFEMLNKEGIKTHFIEKLNERDQLCKKVSIVPLEVIVRNVAAGSMAKRLGLEEGYKLKTTVFELSYKDDELGDPLINDYHAVGIGATTFEELNKIYDNYDIILTPNGGSVAPKLDEANDDRLSDEYLILENHLALGNFAGTPSISIPSGFSEGMPIAINLMGRLFEEQTVLNVAYALEQALGFENQYSREG